MKIKATIFLFFIVFLTSAKSDSTIFIKVHFLYGSKPKKDFKTTEFKYFGGIHGGHVSIQVGNIDYGFEPTDKVHILPHRHKHKSDYVDNIVRGSMRYDTASKVTTFIIPLTIEQYNKLNIINQNYCEKAPYDYAFFGMRCASTAQDVLGQIGVVKRKGRFGNIVSTFYPKKLRKRLFKLAQKNNYTVIKRPGRITRKWEKD
jgi:hypothetical protein